MINFLAILGLGFFLGMRHATDLDHVVAVTTIVTRDRDLYRSTIVGMVWGIGHALTVLIVGGAIVLFGLAIPPRLGLAMEFSVDLMLVLLGAFNLNAFCGLLKEIASARKRGTTIHSRFHIHGDSGPFQTHTQDYRIQGIWKEDDQPGRPPTQISKPSLLQTLRPVVVGIGHGLAGSTGIALLILATIKNPILAMAYLVVFGIGTIISMALITTTIAIPSAYGTQRFAQANRYLVGASGLVSVGFGLFLAYHISFANGLFTGHPQWTPR